jgi:hypothetical protein
VTPTGVKQFKNDLSIKYPTFVSPITSQSLKCEKLAEAVEPIPIRSAYHSSVEEGLPRAFVSRIPSRPAQGLPVNPPAAGPANTQALPQAGTPAPSPPPTPPMKPKKQQYQTDQTRPFVFPFTRNSTAGSSKLVPRAIDEADNLYDQHIYVPLGLYQLYKTRDEFIREESGLGFGLGDLRSGLMGIEKSKDMYEDEEGFGSLEEGEADDEAWTAWKVEDWKLEEKEIEFERQGDSAGLRAIRYKRSSLKRLYRVEVIYVSNLTTVHLLDSQLNVYHSGQYCHMHRVWSWSYSSCFWQQLPVTQLPVRTLHRDPHWKRKRVSAVLIDVSRVSYPLPQP